jgi:beta-glucosidase-like glycosyl hydrolase
MVMPGITSLKKTTSTSKHFEAGGPKENGDELHIPDVEDDIDDNLGLP